MAYEQLFADLESQYGLPSGYLARTAQIESGTNPNAQNPNSSAGGMFQFIDSTAGNYGLEDRFDPYAASDAAARLARDNASYLRRHLGREPTAAELYMAHQQGAGGAVELLSNPNASARSIVGGAAVDLNGGRNINTAGDFANSILDYYGQDNGGGSTGSASSSPQPALSGGSGDAVLSGGSGTDTLAVDPPATISHRELPPRRSDVQPYQMPIMGIEPDGTGALSNRNMGFPQMTQGAPMSGVTANPDGSLDRMIGRTEPVTPPVLAPRIGDRPRPLNINEGLLEDRGPTTVTRPLARGQEPDGGLPSRNALSGPAGGPPRQQPTPALGSSGQTVTGGSPSGRPAGPSSPPPSPALAGGGQEGGEQTAALDESNVDPESGQGLWGRFNEWLNPDRSQMLLAMGTGLLSGDDWASGIAQGGRNVMGVNQNQNAREREEQMLAEERAYQEQVRQQDYAHEAEMLDRRNAAAAAQAAQSGGNEYGRPFSIRGRSQETGEEIVRAARLVDGQYMIPDESGNWVDPSSILTDWTTGGRSAEADVVSGAGGIPNATSISSDGIPTFNFTRSTDGQAYSYASRAIYAEQQLSRMMNHYGPEEFTNMGSALRRWASRNAETSVTPTIINSILDDAGVSGDMQSYMSQYLQAVLRSDTGAAYTGTEIGDYAQTYLPRAGEDMESVINKRRSRMATIAAMNGRAGPAAPYLNGLVDGTYTYPDEWQWQAPAASQTDDVGQRAMDEYY